MEATLEARTKIAAARERDYDRYVEFERQREASLRLDEETDLSERLRLPMESSFDYELREGKLFSEYGDELEALFVKGYDTIAAHIPERPELGFELERRRQDVLELRQAQELSSGEMMVVFSPVPDAVRYDNVKVDAYSRDRLKMLVRVYEHSAKQANKFTITSFSLDGSDYEAMQASAQAIGVAIPDGLGSEEIVTQRHLFAADDERLAASEDIAVETSEAVGASGVSKVVVNRLRSAYDANISQRLGGEWYAGRPVLDHGNALAFVRSHSEVIDAHMQTIKTIMAQVLDDQSRRDMLVSARYNCAAALDDLLHGKEVRSIEEAGLEAREEGRNYDGDCITVQATSTSAQMERLGLRVDSLKCVTCPLPRCGKTVDAERTLEGGIFCPACKREARDGKIIDHSPQAAAVAVPLPTEMKRSAAEKPRDVLQFRHDIAIGTAAVTAMTSSGAVVATGTVARQLYISSIRTKH